MAILHRRSEDENRILENAISSYVHGVQHLVEYEKGNNNIKFSILHIFNSVELILKAYISGVNKALLADNIDAYVEKAIKRGDWEVDKTANISKLMNRMEVFSRAHFDEDLKTDIITLQTERNKIEHKKFILKDEKEMIKVLLNVTYGLLAFCHNNVSRTLDENFTQELKDTLDRTRIALDPGFREIAEEVNNLKSQGYIISKCPRCLNETIACKEIDRKVICKYCNESVVVTRCDECNEIMALKLHAFNADIPNWCNNCDLKISLMNQEHDNEALNEIDENEKNNLAEILDRPSGVGRKEKVRRIQRKKRNS